MQRRQGTGSYFKGTKLLIYLQCYFVTIATILGTGILGLPVTLTQAGMYPFLVSFIASTLMQVLLIYYFTDLLQRACAVQMNQQQDELVPLQDMNDESDEEELFSKGGNEVSRDKPLKSRGDNSVQPPNLHLLGQLFLGCGVRQAFDLMIILQFIALLICYSLAGSEAFAQLVGVSHVYIIPGFVWILTVAVVFALKLIQPVVSILTFLKGSLLLGTTIVTFYVGVSVGREIKNDFHYLGEPFLMGTVALGGIINTMPFIYEKIEFSADQIKRYRFSVLMGLITCSILNVLWCWAVLDIVPQTIEIACIRSPSDVAMETTTMSENFPVILPVSEICTGELSLESAAKHGEISTLPLTKILQKEYPTFNWVAILVELFIVISITVSYLTIGTALHHTLSGWVESHWSKDTFSKCVTKIKNSDTRCHCITGKWLCTVLISITAFIIVFTVAMLNPQGFVQILEKFASFTLNAQAGIFVFLMLIRVRSKENRNVELALPLPRWLSYIQFLLPLYFGFAVGYDIFTTIYGIAVGSSHKSIIPIHHRVNISDSVVNASSVLDFNNTYTTTLSSL